MMRNRKVKKVTAWLLALIAVFCVFAGAIGFSYIAIDDAAYTFRNAFVAGGLTLNGIVEAFTNLRHGGIWMPATHVSYMLDFSASKALGIPILKVLHFSNILLHLANFTLFLFLLRKLLQRGVYDPAVPPCGDLEVSEVKPSGLLRRKLLAMTGWWAKLRAEGGVHGRDGVELPQRKQHVNQPKINGQPVVIARSAATKQSRTTSSQPITKPTLHHPTTVTTQPHFPTSALALLLPALLWAVHPLRAESVAWIAARKELLWTFFALLALLAWQRHTALSVVFAILSCLSKPTAMCLPALILLLDWWNGEFSNSAMRDASASAPASPSGKSTHCSALTYLLSTCKSAWVSLKYRLSSRIFSCTALTHRLSTRKYAYLALVVAAATTALIAAYSQTHVSGQESTSLYSRPFVVRLANALSALGFYLRSAVFPAGLHIDCRLVNSVLPLDGALNLAVLAATAALVLGVLIVLRMRCKRAVAHASLAGNDPNPSAQATAESSAGIAGNQTPHDSATASRDTAKLLVFSVLWFLAGIFPTLGIFGGFGIEAHADRFTYLPAMSFSILLAGLLMRKTSYCEDASWIASSQAPRNDKLVDRESLAGPDASCNAEVQSDRATDHMPLRQQTAIPEPLPTMSLRQQTMIPEPPLTMSLRGAERRSNPELPAPSKKHKQNSQSAIAVSHPHNKTLAYIITPIIVAYAVAGHRQTGHWRDNAAAFGRALERDPGHPRAMVHVADALCSRKRNFDAGIARYREALKLADAVPDGGFNAEDVKARLAYALASRAGYGDLEEVKRLGADVLADLKKDRRGMMLDALGTAFMYEGDNTRAAVLFKASIDAPARFWPKASTQRKLDMVRQSRK